MSRARGQIGFSEAAAAAVRLVGWVGGGGLGIKLLSNKTSQRGKMSR